MAPNDYSSTLPPPGAPEVPGLGAVEADGSCACPFCHIARVYPPYDPLLPPPASSPGLSPEATSPSPLTFIVLSTPMIIAFMDIMPLARGHLLLCPRSHRPKLTNVSAEESRELGFYLPVLSAALGAATGVEDWNVVQNNGAAAAQVVPHMHFHIIPRPDLNEANGGTGREHFSSTMFGRGKREDLDEDDAERLAAGIRAAVAEALAEREQDADKAAKLGRDRRGVKL